MMLNIIFQIILLATTLQAKKMCGKKGLKKKIVRGHGMNPDFENPLRDNLHGTGNPLATMLRVGAALRDGEEIDIVSPIASIKVPDILPILQLITDAASEIYEKISKEVLEAKDQMFKSIDGVFVDAIPEIEKIIVDGNITIRGVINEAFTTATTNFKTVYESVNAKELNDASENISGPNAAMLAQILEVLNTTQDEINKNITAGLGQSIDVVTEALNNTNNAIYAQIEKLLADENNVASIASQITYVVPSTITGVLVDTSRGIYDYIYNSIEDALKKIKVIIDTQSDISYKQQENTLNSANTTLFGSLTDEVNAALSKIQKELNKITNDEVRDVSQIIKDMEPEISKAIGSSISELETDVKEIVTTVTNRTVEKTKEMIQTNNTEILTLVVQILAAYNP